VSGELPLGQWAVYNATLIGRGKTATGFGGGIGWNSRDEASPNVINSIFSEFAVGVLIDTDGANEFTSGSADMRNTIVDAAVGPSGANAIAQLLFTNVVRLNTVESPLLGGVSYTNDMCLNPRPTLVSPAFRNVAAQGPGLVATTYRGAFAPGDQWAYGWSALDELGYLKGAYYPVPAAVTCVATTLSIVQTAGYVDIVFASVPGATYRLLGSTSVNAPLASWTQMGTVNANEATTTFNVPSTAAPQQFYVVVCQ